MGGKQKAAVHTAHESRHRAIQVSIQVLSVLIMVFSLVFSAYNTYLLIQDKKPYIISSELICPEKITTGMPIEMTLSNIGGTYTDYELILSANGFRCFNNNMLKVTSLYDSEVAEWNKKTGATKCSIKGVLAKDATTTNNIFIFNDNQKQSDKSEFIIGYSYKDNNKIISLPSKTCNYKKQILQSSQVWVLSAE